MRLTWKKTAALVAAGIISASLIAGCGGESKKSGGALKNEINVAINAEPNTFDVGRSTSTMAAQMVLGNVFERLVAFDKDYKVVPELAEKIDVNSNFTEYVYHLRKGIKFHNGSEMKADDVVASMNRWIKYNGLARNAVGKASFTKVDDYTVKITLAEPVMALNDLIAGIRPAPIVVPKAVIDKMDPAKGMITEYIGTGPYKITEHKTNRFMKLEKFAEYKPYGEKGKVSGWAGYKEAKTPKVIYNFVPDASTRVAGMKSGEYDVAVQLPFDDYEQFNGKDQFKVYKESQGDVGLIYNKKAGIASNKLIRQAINAALNQEDIMKAAYSKPDFYLLTPSLMQNKLSPWYTEIGKEFYNMHNQAKAKALLQQAGYKGEEFRLLVSNHYQEFYNAAVVIEKELKDVGVNIKLNVTDWSTYLTNAKNPAAYDAFITGFIDWPNPNVAAYLSPSWNGWSADPKLQGMLKSIAHATDAKAAKATWEQTQLYCWSEYLPMSKFGNRYVYDVSSANVKNLQFFEGLHMWEVTVSK